MNPRLERDPDEMVFEEYLKSLDPHDPDNQVIKANEGESTLEFLLRVRAMTPTEEEVEELAKTEDRSQ